MTDETSDIESKSKNKKKGSKKKGSKKKNPKQNIIKVFNPTDNCEVNLASYVDNAKAIQPAMFDYGVNWDCHEWDIKGFESTTRVHKVAEEANILFTQHNGKQPKAKSSKDDEVPFDEPFASFARAYITHRHKEKSKTHDSHMVAMRGLRYLYMQLPEKTPCISMLRPIHFNASIRFAIEREATPTIYRTGGQLAAVSEVIDEYKLTPVPIDWQNPIPRDYSQGGSGHNRGSEEAKEKRAKHLPKTDALMYLSALWGNFDELEEKDKALVCMAIILMLSGFRMDEFVGLDVNCIPSRKEYEAQELELDPLTGTWARVLKIRVMAKKIGHWVSKIVPNSAVDTIFDAVERLKKLSEPHRYAAKLMFEENKWYKFEHFEDDELISIKTIQEILGCAGEKSSNTIATIERYGAIRDADSTRGNTRFHVGTIHEAFSDYYKNRIKTIKDGYGSGSFKIMPWEFLTLRFKDQYTPKEKLNVFAEPLTGTMIQDFFKGRDYKTRTKGEDRRIESIFERYEFPELEKIKTYIRTHQFRHLINTLMQESDMFSQEDIAKNFLRKGAKDNAAYNHQIEPQQYAERTTHLQNEVLKKINVSSEAAKAAVKQFPTLSHEELQRDLDDMGSYHFMGIGRCRHDYSQGVCGMHYMCLRNCINYKRQKGNQKEIDNITKRRDQTLHQMKLAREDMEDGLYGANNWYLNHKELVEGCEQALLLEADEQYELGEIVQIFPNGIDCCEEDE